MGRRRNVTGCFCPFRTGFCSQTTDASLSFRTRSRVGRESTAQRRPPKATSAMASQAPSTPSPKKVPPATAEGGGRRADSLGGPRSPPRATGRAPARALDFPIGGCFGKPGGQTFSWTVSRPRLQSTKLICTCHRTIARSTFQEYKGTQTASMIHYTISKHVNEGWSINMSHKRVDYCLSDGACYSSHTSVFWSVALMLKPVKFEDREEGHRPPGIADKVTFMWLECDLKAVGKFWCFVWMTMPTSHPIRTPQCGFTRLLRFSCWGTATLFIFRQGLLCRTFASCGGQKPAISEGGWTVMILLPRSHALPGIHG